MSIPLDIGLAGFPGSSYISGNWQEYLNETTHFENGGWKGSPPSFTAEYDISHCDIDVLDSITYKEFLDNYHEKAPFKIRAGNMGQNGTMTYDPADWTRDNLYKKHGHEDILVVDAAISASYNGDPTSHWTTLKSYIERLENDDVAEKDYVFQVTFPRGQQSAGPGCATNDNPNCFHKTDSLRNNEHIPWYVDPDQVTSILALGGTGQGLPFHAHGPAVFQMMYGRKRWALAPPSGTLHFDPNRSFTDWVDHHRQWHKLGRGGDVLECVQTEGEFLYIPSQFYHGTLNYGITLGVVFQSLNMRTFNNDGKLPPLHFINDETSSLIDLNFGRWALDTNVDHYGDSKRFIVERQLKLHIQELKAIRRLEKNTKDAAHLYRHVTVLGTREEVRKKLIATSFKLVSMNWLNEEAKKKHTQTLKKYGKKEERAEWKKWLVGLKKEIQAAESDETISRTKVMKSNEEVKMDL